MVVPMDDVQQPPVQASASLVENGAGTVAPDVASLPGQLLVSVAAVGIVAVDDKGVIRSCNPAAEKILARPARELIGIPLGYPSIVDAISEMDVVLPNGDLRPVELRVSSTTWQGRPLYVAALHEFDRPARTADELRDDLDHQNTAIAVIAHELDDPLVAVKLSCQRLRRDMGLDAGRRTDLMNRIDDCTQRMQDLVRKLRIVSRLDAQQTNTIRESIGVLDFVLDRIKEPGHGMHDVRVICAPDVEVATNRTELCQMLDNYLDNAELYGLPPFEIRVTREKGWVTLRVCDNGHGVPESFVPHLFHRFRRLSDIRHSCEGTGLGLWITRGLARAHGGEAWYEPHEPRGACFCVRLPAQPDREPQSGGTLRR